MDLFTPKKRGATHRDVVLDYLKEIASAGDVVHGEYQGHHDRLQQKALAIIAFERQHKISEPDPFSPDERAHFEALFDRQQRLDARARAFSSPETATA